MFFKGRLNVIMVIWGLAGDPPAADKDHALEHLMCWRRSTATTDLQGQRRRLRARAPGRDPRTAALVKTWTDDEIWAPARRQHYRRCTRPTRPPVEHTGQPTVILAHTIKGYILGSHCQQLHPPDEGSLGMTSGSVTASTSLSRTSVRGRLPRCRPCCAADDDPALLYGSSGAVASAASCPNGATPARVRPAR